MTLCRSANSDEGSKVLRENEKILRRCPSITHAKKLLPTIISDASVCSPEQLHPVGKTSGGHTVYRLAQLKDSVYFLPAFLSRNDCNQLADDILNGMIDNPPHANSLPDPRRNIWKEYLHDPSDQSTPMNKLRWSCVGYHYNWGDRTYEKSKRSTFPESFSKYYNEVLEAVNKAENGDTKLTGVAESAIINFYHSHRISDRLGGHRDDVEATDSTPLVSISMGLGGIFRRLYEGGIGNGRQ
jgi:alkylated DNA repair dioxygenase AlkB